MGTVELRGSPKADLIETGVLVGCTLHTPTRTLVKNSARLASVLGWSVFDEYVPDPVAVAYFEGPLDTVFWYHL